jgi:hypothetical protein
MEINKRKSDKMLKSRGTIIVKKSLDISNNSIQNDSDKLLKNRIEKIFDKKKNIIKMAKLSNLRKSM